VMLPAWEDRPPEVAHLLNPSFCGELLRRAIWGFREESGGYFPFPFSYIVLPLVLHGPTRRELSTSSKYLHNWIEEHSHLLTEFSVRAESFLPFATEGLFYLLRSGEIRLTPEGLLSAAQPPVPSAGTGFTPEVRDCMSKSVVVGKMLARAQSIEAVFVSLGVRP
jgi:hypothetical protein